MPAEFDPYLEWLDISPAEQPADYYRLLGLAPFERDLTRIAAAADERMAALRRYQTGPRGQYTQKLLNELAAARVCLVDHASKERYDGELAARLTQLEATRRAQAAKPVAEVAAKVSLPLPPPAAPRAGRTLWWVAAACLAAIIVAAAGLVAIQMLSPLASRAPGGGGSRANDQTNEPKTPLAAEQQPVVLPASGGVFECRPEAATLEGDLRIVAADGDAMSFVGGTGGAATWNLNVQQPGFFRVQVEYASIAAAEGVALQIEAGRRPRLLTLRSTGGLDTFEVDSTTVAVERSGRQTLVFRPLSPPAGEWLRVRAIRLVPMRANLTP